MKYCSNCGMQIQDSELNCPVCGTDSAAFQQPLQKHDPQPVKKHANRAAVLITVLVCISLIGACGLVLYHQVRDTVTGVTDTANSLKNMADAAIGEGSQSIFSKMFGQLDGFLTNEATGTDASEKEIIFSGNIMDDLKSNLGDILGEGGIDGIQSQIDSGNLDETSQALVDFFGQWIGHAFIDPSKPIEIDESLEQDVDQAADIFMGLIGGDMSVLEPYGYSEEDIQSIADAVQEKILDEEYEYSESEDVNTVIDSLLDLID